MKCRKQPPYFKYLPLEIEITNIWDVVLDDEIWYRIQALARSMGKSYSAITRYCVFRIVRHARIPKLQAVENHSMRVKDAHRAADGQHRHQLCLYGEDEKLLRHSAMQLDVRVSHLVRMCLYWYIPILEAYQKYKAAVRRPDTHDLFEPSRYDATKRYCRDVLKLVTGRKKLPRLSQRRFFFDSIKIARTIHWGHWQRGSEGMMTVVNSHRFRAIHWFAIPK